MTVDGTLQDADQKMRGALSVARDELAGLRTGRANPKLLDRVSVSGAVAITRHDTPKAVLLSFEEFESLSSARSETLDALPHELLELHVPPLQHAHNLWIKRFSRFFFQPRHRFF